MRQDRSGAGGDGGDQISLLGGVLWIEEPRPHTSSVKSHNSEMKHIELCEV